MHDNFAEEHKYAPIQCHLSEGTNVDYTLEYIDTTIVTMDSGVTPG